MTSATTERSLSLVLAIAVTAGVLGTIGQIALVERQTADTAVHPAPAEQLAVACEPGPAAQL